VQIDTAKKERALAVEMHARLERIRPDHDAFLAKLHADRASVYKVTRTKHKLSCLDVVAVRIGTSPDLCMPTKLDFSF